MLPESVLVSCRDRINEIAQATLTAEVVGEPVPQLSIGGIASKPALEVIVHEVPQSVDFQRAATCPVYDLYFDVLVDFIAKRKGLVEASDLVTRWFEAFMQGVLLDQTLGGLCFAADPRYQDAGTGVDQSSRLYIAAITAAVHVRCHYKPSKEAAEAIESIQTQEVTR